MPNEVVAADEKVEQTYLLRLFEALGTKGVAVLLAVPAALGLAGVGSIVDPVIAGSALVVVFAFAAAVDSRRDSASSVDTVGVSFVVVVAAYTGLLYTGIPFDWRYAVGAAGLVLGAVMYEYLSKGGETLGEVHEGDVDPLHLDIVGFVTAEVLVVYAVLHATGWGGFADSPVFVILAYIIFASTVAAFAGYAVITREIVVSRTSQEVHAALLSTIKDVSEISDEDLRKKLALNVRRVAECLDGIRLPTNVEDRYGRVPAVVSTRKPEVRRIDLRVKDVVDIADRAGFTGYVVQGDAVFVFRNGRMAKYYDDGEFFEDIDDVEDRVGDVSFYSLEYPTVMNLIEVTPDEGEVRRPERVVEEIQDKEVDESAKAGQSLSIGGAEVDVNEMFSITEELVDESPKSDDATLDIGGDELDVDELMDRADDVIEELSE